MKRKDNGHFFLIIRICFTLLVPNIDDNGNYDENDGYAGDDDDNAGDDDDNDDDDDDNAGDDNDDDGRDLKLAESESGGRKLALARLTACTRNHQQRCTRAPTNDCLHQKPLGC